MNNLCTPLLNIGFDQARSTNGHITEFYILMQLTRKQKKKKPPNSAILKEPVIKGYIYPAETIKLCDS